MQLACIRNNVKRNVKYLITDTQKLLSHFLLLYLNAKMYKKYKNP